MKSVARWLRFCRQTTLLAIALFTLGNSAAVADSLLDLSDYRGKVVVVDFWASWCVPCRRSFPWMNQMQQKYASDGLVIIGVNLDAHAADAQAFLRDVPADFRIVEDPFGELAREYAVVAMPSSFVFDRNGEIATRHYGFKVKKQQEYESVLVDLLKQPGETD